MQYTATKNQPRRVVHAAYPKETFAVPVLNIGTATGTFTQRRDVAAHGLLSLQRCCWIEPHRAARGHGARRDASRH